MEYIKKISQDEYEYFQEETKRVYATQEKLKTFNKKAMIILFLAIFILIIFFNDNNFYFSFFILASLSYFIWFLEKQLMLLLDRQSSLNELMLKTIDTLALDKFFKERSDYIDFHLMGIFWDFWKKYDNIYFDEEGQNESDDKYISASSLKKYIRNKLMNKYNDIGDTYDFEDIHKELEEVFIKPRN